jgi:hypothetical protein
MTRETLQAILRAASGVQEKSNTFRAAAELRVTFYLGNDGRGLAVTQIEEVKLEEGYIALRTKDVAQIFADYGALYAVTLQPPKENAPKKAGFA